MKEQEKNHFIYANLPLGRRLMVDRHQAIIARRARRRAKKHNRGMTMLARIHDEIAIQRAATIAARDWLLTLWED